MTRTLRTVNEVEDKSRVDIHLSVMYLVRSRLVDGGVETRIAVSRSAIAAAGTRIQRKTKDMAPRTGKSDHLVRGTTSRLE